MDSTTSAQDLREQVLGRARAVGELDLVDRDVAAVELLGELESLKNTIAAAQATLAVTLKESRVAQRAHQPAATRERGIGAEVALARRESPHRGGIHLGLAVVLCTELPHTLAAMEAGWCSEWRAIQLAQGTACLSLADRMAVDAELMGDPATTDVGVLGGSGPRSTGSRTPRTRSRRSSGAPRRWLIGTPACGRRLTG